jgi:abhydrolase domain-containing protein 6
VCALLAVEEWGSGETLVLVHGLATTRWIWDLVAPQLAEARRVVTLDVPGFGESAAVGAGFELNRVADRIARGLAAHGVRGPFDLVGHSLGAGVATALAVRRPATVRRLVLVAPAGFGAVPPAISRILAAGADPLLAVRRALLPMADFPWGRRLLLGGAAVDGAAIAPGIARRMVTASESARRTPEALMTIGEGRLAALLAQTTMPLGVIWGREDRTVPSRNVDAVRRVRSDAEVELIDDAGHVPMIERPAEFTAALERLLETHTAPPEG